LIALSNDPVLRQAEAACRQLAKQHYENFLVGSLFLPRRVRQDFFNVYAYCRRADDLADQSESPELALQRLAEWRRGLLQSVAAELDPATLPHPIFVALAATIRRHALPTQPFLDLLDAFEQDQTTPRYETFEQLRDYCRRSANPVGRIVLRLAGVDDPELDRLSDAICTGLQLANFWQDIQRDLQIGRIYLPAEDCLRFEVQPSDLQATTATPAVKQLIRFQVDRAESFFHRGLPLAEQVPGWLSRDVRLFAHGGLQTLAAIRRVDYDVLRRRPTVSRWQQAKLLLRASIGRLT